MLRSPVFAIPPDLRAPGESDHRHRETSSEFRWGRGGYGDTSCRSVRIPNSIRHPLTVWRFQNVQIGLNEIDEWRKKASSKLRKNAPESSGRRSLSSDFWEWHSTQPNRFVWFVCFVGRSGSLVRAWWEVGGKAATIIAALQNPSGCFVTLRGDNYPRFVWLFHSKCPINSVYWNQRCKTR